MGDSTRSLNNRAVWSGIHGLRQSFALLRRPYADSGIGTDFPVPDQVVEKAPYARQVTGDGSRRQAPRVQSASEVPYIVGFDSCSGNPTRTRDEAPQVPAIRSDRVPGGASFHHQMGEETFDIGVHADLRIHPAA